MKSNRHMTRGSLISLVENGKISAVETLLSRGLSANVTNSLDKTLLHIATFNGDEKMVKLLLKYEAKVDKGDYQGRTPIHLAAWLGHIGIFKLLVDSCGYEGRLTNINIRTPRNEVPLHFAAMQGHLHLIKFIIQNGGEVEVQEMNKFYPLNWAVSRAHPECVKELLKHIDINDAEKYGKLIHMSVRGHFIGSKSKVKLSKDKELRYVEVINLLFNSGINFKMEMDYTPISEAVYNKFYLIAKTLHEHHAKVDGNYLSKCSVFAFAATHAPVDFINMLIKAGADVSKKSNMGLLPIHEVGFGKNYKILSLLIRAGADINAQAHNKRTIIDCILDFKPKDVLFLYIILMYGTNIYAIGAHGQTGLHTLCFDCFHYSEYSGILIDWFLDFNVVNVDDETPIQYAINLGATKKQIESIIKMMVKMKSDRRFKHSQVNMDTIIYHGYLKFYQACIKELQSLKLNKVWDKISFFELLDKPLEKLREYTKNFDLMDAFHTIRLRDSCPIYGDLIKSRMRFATCLRNFHDRSLETLNELISPIKLPDVVVRKILSFLNVDELEKLSLM